MTQLREAPFQRALIGANPRREVTDLWRLWFTQVARYLRAQLVTGTGTITISVANGSNQSFDITVTQAEQGDIAMASIDDAGADGILIAAHAQSGIVRVTIRNESGSSYAPGAVTVRASAWKH